jgi:ABC-type siderophore export system fused ATPase/permease subunit
VYVNRVLVEFFVSFITIGFVTSFLIIVTGSIFAVIVIPIFVFIISAFVLVPRVRKCKRRECFDIKLQRYVSIVENDEEMWVRLRVGVGFQELLFDCVDMPPVFQEVPGQHMA